ncbi:MAG: DNA-protecting protein DprA [Spirochaetaceae bacterium]|nr:MAG: DNA-protecting protein DprA [Spirochaetaceae bacterium]
MKSRFLLAINRAEFLTCREKQLVAELVDSEQFFLSLSVDDLSQIVGRILRATSWDPARFLHQAEQDVRYLERESIGTILVTDNAYPAQLGAIYDPPFLLHYRGTLPAWDRPLVAIVGTRSPSEQALLATRRLAESCAAAGIAVVSGLARGIDAAAHAGVVSAHGVTLAVLGSGIDVIYPQAHKALARGILANGGALVSEYPPRTAPTRYHFPERNRIISGLARAVVVAEAPIRSGALITAEYALEQGRDLFVLREGLDGDSGAGGRNLAADGSVMVSTAADIIADWVGGSAAPAAASATVTVVSADRRPAAAGRQLALELEAELKVGFK